MVELICPECGGLIGATERDAQGRAPCECVAISASYKKESESEESAHRLSDTDAIAAPAIAQPTAANPAKICVICGKDVAGHRRVKDTRGYLCYDCAKAAQIEDREKIPCAECGRRVKEAGLVVFGGLKICKLCYEDHKAGGKRVVKKVSTKNFDQEEKRSLLVLGIIVGVLGLIVLWRLAAAFL